MQIAIGFVVPCKRSREIIDIFLVSDRQNTSSERRLLTRMATDEDDYLTMTFEEPTPIPQAETYSQRRARKLREHESNMHITPPKILERERLEEGLARNMFEETESKKESKAMRMMKMMGYTEGKGLGSEESNGKLEPLSLEIPDGKSFFS